MANLALFCIKNAYIEQKMLIELFFALKMPTFS